MEQKKYHEQMIKAFNAWMNPMPQDMTKAYKKPRFGDRMRNTSMSPDNPMAVATFSKVVEKKYTNRQGITHRSMYYEMTDGRGKFWLSTPEVMKNLEVME